MFSFFPLPSPLRHNRAIQKLRYNQNKEHTKKLYRRFLTIHQNALWHKIYGDTLRLALTDDNHLEDTVDIANLDDTVAHFQNRLHLAYKEESTSIIQAFEQLQPVSLRSRESKLRRKILEEMQSLQDNHLRNHRSSGQPLLRPSATNQAPQTYSGPRDNKPLLDAAIAALNIPIDLTLDFNANAIIPALQAINADTIDRNPILYNEFPFSHGQCYNVGNGICYGLSTEFLRIKHSNSPNDIPGLSLDSLIRARHAQSYYKQTILRHTYLHSSHIYGRRIPTGPLYNQMRRHLHKALLKPGKASYFLTWKSVIADAGHALAIHKENDDDIQFFDSNQGIIYFLSVNDCLVFLDETYASIEGDNPNSSRGFDCCPPAAGFQLRRYYPEHSAKQSFKHFLQYKITNPWYYIRALSLAIYLVAMSVTAIPLTAVSLIGIISFIILMNELFLPLIDYCMHSVKKAMRSFWKSVGFTKPAESETPRQVNVPVAEHATSAKQPDVPEAAAEDLKTFIRLPSP